MADLSGFWRKQHAIAVAEFDQKSSMAQQLIAENFEPEESEKLRDVINFFAGDERAMMSLMGILAQVGLCAMAMQEFGSDDDAE